MLTGPRSSKGSGSYPWVGTHGFWESFPFGAQRAVWPELLGYPPSEYGPGPREGRNRKDEKFRRCSDFGHSRGLGSDRVRG